MSKTRAESEADSPARWQREILALRRKLESLDHENDLALTRQAAEYRQQEKQLQEIIAALRAELEAASLARDEAVQQVRRGAALEIGQLRETIFEQRRQFDDIANDLKAKMTAEAMDAKRRRAELEATILALRSQLDASG